MITNFITAYTKLLEVLKAATLKTIFASFLVILLLYVALRSFSTDMKLDELVKTPDIESQTWKNSVQVDNKIMIKMERTRQQLDADRILVRQFHNGKKDLTNNDFVSIATKYIVVKEGIIISPNAFDSYPTSSMNSILNRMWFNNYSESRCIYGHTKDVKSAFHRAYFEELGTQFYAMCPIETIDNHKIGLIGVMFTQEQNDEVGEFAIKELGYLSKEISLLLQSINPNNQKEWYQFW